MDGAMRNVVAWYDRGHPNSPGHIRQMRNAAGAAESAMSDLRKRNSSLCEQVKHKDREIEALAAELKGMRKNMEGYVASQAELEDNIASLTDRLQKQICESDRLRSRCLPEERIPAMIYYAAPDAEGSGLRKVAATRDATHIYRLVTLPGDSTRARFQPIGGANDDQVIANRNIYLMACDITAISSNPTAITVDSPGTAILENNNWIVTTKAKIKLT